MRLAAFLFDRAPRASIALLLTASGSGLVAYADSNSDVTIDSSQAPVKKKVVVLGTGWAGTSFLKNLDSTLYDVQVVSPRNYFTFTPLLPSVTCGTVEARSIVEPVRKIIKKKRGEIKFWEAECYKIDQANKKIHCHSEIGTNLNGRGEFELHYDYLVIALGARANTFNTPGVVEHCHFLKEVEDAQRIRKSVLQSFERASLPELEEEEKKKCLHFVIVGSGPTGVEFAAELHDFVTEDMVELYPNVCDLVRISVIGSAEHILTMFDKRISRFAEDKFQRDGIELKSGFVAVKVTDDAIIMKKKFDKSAEEISMPYGMAVWSTGIGTCPVILDLMKQLGQGDRRALATNEWLKVQNCDGVYALGDCATISQRKVM